MAEIIEGLGGMGWLPDLPDFRHFTPETDVVLDRHRRFGQTDSIKAMLKKLGAGDPVGTLPPSVDLRPWCSPVENQSPLNSCTAHAGVGLVEYFERRAFGTWIDASRLFLYKVTRDLLFITTDIGATLSATMGGMVLFGVPPEKYWPYVPANVNVEPSAFLYAFAQNYQAIQYYRYDPPGTPTDVLLQRIKTYLAAGLPCMFGFAVYSSFSQAATTGKIPFPTPAEGNPRGHAVDAVGYDDAIKIKNSNPGGVETTGALLIRNSWGTAWGPLGGYLWLPYEYVLKGLAVDWWSLLKNEWVATKQFGLATTP